jgi:thioredoxin-dependent peroxiredoxin
MGLFNDSSEVSGIEIGEKAPDFTLFSNSGEEWRLSEQNGKVTALLFYPQNETLVCTRQLCSVRDSWTDYLETKASVVGISCATIEEHQQFSKNYRLPLPLLADVDRKITGLYGKHWLMPIQFTRAIVIVDAKGIIRHRKIMLRAFRPTDKSVLASIYAARTDLLYENYEMIKESYRRNKISE